MGEKPPVDLTVRDRSKITPQQHGVLHHWDVHIEVLGKQIAEAKKGSWRERWERLDKQLIEDRDKRIGWNR